MLTVVSDFRPPEAPRRCETRVVHDDVVVDPYAWMRDEDDPALLAYLQAENEYARRATADLAGLSDAIYADISARTLQTDLSVPDFVTHSDGQAYWYYARTTEGADHPRYFRRPARSRDELPLPDDDADEQLLLDLQAEADGHEFFALDLFDVSPDGSRLAYSVDMTGDERFTLRWVDLASGRRLGPDVTGVSSGGAWSGDSAYCYLRIDDAWRPHEVWRHQLDATQPDELLFTEPDEHFWLGVGESRDRRYVEIVAASKTTSETWLLAVGNPAARPVSFARRREGVEYDIELLGDDAYIVHNDDAPDFALAHARVGASDPDQWQEILPGTLGVRLLDVDAYERALVVSVCREGIPRVLIARRDADGGIGPFKEIEADEPLFTLEADDEADADTDRIRLSYQSLVTPQQVLEYRFDTGERQLLKRRPVLDHPVWGPYRPGDYVQERVWAQADDGVRIPISLVRHRRTPLDGSAGCLLYGYGAYEVSIVPTFSIARLSLLDRGYVYAVAHVRGGGELGRSWYDGGKLNCKMTTFTDFIACARQLVAQGYTSPSRLAIEGGSAGGLLIGAVCNLAPELVAAAHADVPFVDPLTTILDPSLPLTVTEWDEWGDPVHDADAYRYIKSYSPYENVRDARYPALLVTTSMNDTRVEVTEPAKWVAALRHVTESRSEILLKTELAAGHGGVSGRYQEWREDAFELAWLMDRTRNSGSPRTVD